MGAPKAKVEKDNSERWLLTYSDLMNLLLILFIILFAMSQIDAAKFNQLAASLRSAFGDSNSASYIGTAGTSNTFMDLEAGNASTVIPENLENQQMEEAQKEIKQVIKSSGIENQVIVTIEERGVVISIKDSLLFKSGSASIEPGAKGTLEKIGGILTTLPKNQIRVEGYTDNDPIKTSQFPSNWELSSARATTVLRLLVDTAKLDPKIVSAVGYGEFRPDFPNTSPENKAQNRKVKIVIVKSSYDKAEAGIQNLEQTTASSEDKTQQNSKPQLSVSNTTKP